MVTFLNGIRFIKILATIGFLCITLALLVIDITPPASSYEISIYDVFSLYFWLLLIIAIACGIFILIYYTFTKLKSSWWLSGFSLVLTSNLVILLLPFFRGYTVFARTRGDELTHIGYIKDILFTGHFAIAGESGANYYPVIHILGANFSLINGISPELLTVLLPVFFTLFYIFSIYLLAREIAPDFGQIILITAFGSLLLFGHENLMLSPSVACFYMLPFILFLFCKSRTSKNRLIYSVLLILLLLLMPFFHPGEGSLFLIITFLCIEFSLWLYLIIKKPTSKDCSSPFGLKSASSLIPILILFITWFAWFSTYSTFSITVGNIVNWIVNQIGSTTALEYSSLLAKTGLSFFEIVELIFKMWGQAIIYCLGAIAVSLLIWKRFLLPKSRINMWQFSFSFLFVVFIVLLFISFFTRSIWVDFNREMRYVIFVATILNGLYLYKLTQTKHKRICAFLIFLLLIIPATIGVFNTFPSPIVVEANSQVTEMEMIGMSWFFGYRNDSHLIDDRDVPQTRFWVAIHGVSTPSTNLRDYAPDSPPDNFGYFEKSNFGKSYTEDRYYVDSKLSRIIYPELAQNNKRLWKFTPEDFSRMDNDDSSVSKLYSNGEFWAYYVRASGNTSH